MAAQYRVTLTQDEVNYLKNITSKGKHPSKTVLYARALLLLDKGEFTDQHWTLEQVAEALGVTTRSLNHLKERFVTKGLEESLKRKVQDKPSRPIIFDGEFEARLTELACTEPPEGFSRWTVRLLADKLVELSIVDKVSPMTVQRVLKKKKLSLISASTGKSPKGSPENS